MTKKVIPVTDQVRFVPPTVSLNETKGITDPPLTGNVMLAVR
jgi:hypothetical protein